jgi:hypothetical protein
LLHLPLHLKTFVAINNLISIAQDSAQLDIDKPSCEVLVSTCIKACALYLCAKSVSSYALCRNLKARATSTKGTYNKYKELSKWADTGAHKTAGPPPNKVPSSSSYKVSRETKRLRDDILQCSRGDGYKSPRQRLEPRLLDTMHAFTPVTGQRFYSGIGGVSTAPEFHRTKKLMGDFSAT